MEELKNLVNFDRLHLFLLKLKTIFSQIGHAHPALTIKTETGEKVYDGTAEVEVQALKGEDGYSPTITKTDTSDGYQLTIKDKNGTQTVDIHNGTDATLDKLDSFVYSAKGYQDSETKDPQSSWYVRSVEYRQWNKYNGNYDSLSYWPSIAWAYLTGNKAKTLNVKRYFQNIRSDNVLKESATSSDTLQITVPYIEKVDESTLRVYKTDDDFEDIALGGGSSGGGSTGKEWVLLDEMLDVTDFGAVDTWHTTKLCNFTDYQSGAFDIDKPFIIDVEWIEEYSLKSSSNRKTVTHSDRYIAPSYNELAKLGTATANVYSCSLQTPISSLLSYINTGFTQLGYSEAFSQPQDSAKFTYNGKSNSVDFNMSILFRQQNWKYFLKKIVVHQE